MPGLAEVFDCAGDDEMARKNKTANHPMGFLKIQPRFIISFPKRDDSRRYLLGTKKSIGYFNGI